MAPIFIYSFLVVDRRNRIQYIEKERFCVNREKGQRKKGGQLLWSLDLV